MVEATKSRKQQFTSTKTIFDKVSKEALRAVKARKTVKHGKRIKAKEPPEHGLSAAFSASIEQSREHILESVVTNYDAVSMGLSQCLTEANEYYDKKDNELANIAEEFTAPFKEEELDWTSTDNKKTGTIVLSHRTKKLQKIVDAEERELVRQWGEWLEVEAEIDRLTAEFAATRSREELDQMEMMEEIKAEKVRFAMLIEQAAKASIKSMEEGEIELTLKQRRIEDQFLNVLREEEYVE